MLTDSEGLFMLPVRLLVKFWGSKQLYVNFDCTEREAGGCPYPCVVQGSSAAIKVWSRDLWGAPKTFPEDQKVKTILIVLLYYDVWFGFSITLP